MRKLYLLIAVLLPVGVLAQVTQGQVIYEESQELQFNFGGDMGNDEIKSMMPSTRTSYKQLLFTPEASIFMKYENLEKKSGNDMSFTTASGAQVAIKMRESDNQFYRDLANETIIDKIEFMGKDFLIEEPAEKFEWKITGESKTILDYQVMKATIEDTTGVTEAWFAPQIPVSSGPGKYGSLPGLILELSISDGERILTATLINFDEVDTDKIVAPKKGKKVTREEFAQIEEEKRKEMEEMYGGKGGKRVIIDHK